MTPGARTTVRNIIEQTRRTHGRVYELAESLDRLPGRQTREEGAALTKAEDAAVARAIAAMGLAREQLLTAMDQLVSLGTGKGRTCKRCGGTGTGAEVPTATDGLSDWLRTGLGPCTACSGLGRVA